MIDPQRTRSELDMTNSRDAGEAKNLLTRFRQGDTEAAALLIELFYEELRRIARGQMRTERLSHTLQPTALVNELFFKLRPPEDVSAHDEHILQHQSDFL